MFGGQAKKPRVAGGPYAGKETHFLTIHHEDDETAKVQLHQPVEISTASKDLDGEWTPGNGMLAYFKAEKLPYDLNHKYHEWQHIELGRAELTFAPIMEHLHKQVTAGKLNAPEAHVVSWRGNLSKIMCTPYSSGKDDWEISVSRRNGVLYFDSRETESCQYEKLNPSPMQRKFTYYGYKFENYCTGEGEKGVNTSVLGAGFHSICCGKLGEMKYLVAAEVDCCSADPPAKNYMELKTSRIMTAENQVHTFEMHKMLKYWAQSITVGVPRVVVGFRTEEGHVTKLQRFYTADLPKLAGVTKSRPEALWTSRKCLSFLHRVFKWCDRTIQDDETWLMRLDPGESELKLIRGVPRKKHHVYDPRWYTAVRPPRREAWEPAATAVAGGAGVGGATARPVTPPVLER